MTVKQIHILMLMLKSRHEGFDAASVRSPVVDEERTRPGHWLGLGVSGLCFL